MFANRLIKPELLDHLPPEEARPNLKDLVRINTRFGGHSVLKKTLERVTGPREPFTLLDVGAASGDSARLIAHLYPEAIVTSLDLNPVNIEEAPQPKLLADARELPFAAGSFDFVLCSLFLHHFEDEQAAQFLASFYAIARRALLICDLERRVLPFLFLPATKLLFGWHDITVHDGVISVRAAFRAPELLQLAKRARVKRAEVRVYRPAFRLAMIASK